LSGSRKAEEAQGRVPDRLAPAREEALRLFYGAWHQLRRGHMAKAMARWARSSADQHLNMSEIDILIQLGQHPEGISIGELAVAAMADRANTSATVTRLERMGYVTRGSTADGRVVIARPTEQGRVAVRNIVLRRKETFVAAFDDWSERELDRFIEDLESVIARIQRHVGDGAGGNQEEGDQASGTTL